MDKKNQSLIKVIDPLIKFIDPLIKVKKFTR